MLTTDLVEEVRDILDDPNSIHYQDAEIVRHADRQLQILARTQVRFDMGYHNFELHLQKGDAVQLYNQVWEYRLPSWVVNVTRVWQIDDPASAEPTFSPYLWSEEATIGSIVEKIDKADVARGGGWYFAGNNAIQLRGFASETAMRVQVAKLPAPLFLATLATAHADADKLYLPASLTLGTERIELGDYINADVVVTTLNTATNDYRGVRRRCIYSTPNADDGGTRRHELSMDAAFSGAPLEVGDAIETQVPLPEEHTRLLCLKVARACLQKRGNREAIISIANELRYEQAMFEARVTPRDTHAPDFVRRRTGRRRALTEDEDRRAWYYG